MKIESPQHELYCRLHARRLHLIDEIKRRGLVSRLEGVVGRTVFAHSAAIARSNAARPDLGVWTYEITWEELLLGECENILVAERQQQTYKGVPVRYPRAFFFGKAG
jgi:hypothetical protein